MTTEADLAEWERLAAEATPGPWTSDDGNIFSAPLQEQRHEVIMRRLNGEKVPHPDHDVPGLRDNPLGFVCTTTQDQPNFEADEEFIRAARTAVPALVAALREAWACLAKINDIRNSIVGLQTINWSEHIYPLVAALDAAGVQGAPFEKARADVGTLLQQRDAADVRAEAAEAEVVRLRGALKDLAEHECSYGDGCPPFGSRHGRCVGCVARTSLEGSSK